MPYIDLKTNIDLDHNQIEIIKKLLGREITLIPGKTERWLMTRVSGSENMSFAGTNEPCVMAEVSIFGSADDDAYAALTASLSEKLRIALNIPKSRIYIKYQEISKWGWNGDNF